MTPGNRYYFEIKIIKGNLIKIGISKDNESLDEVGFLFRHLVIHRTDGRFIMGN